MAYKIVWTDAAIEDYQNVVEYLFNNWSYEIVLAFIDITKEKIHTISLQPSLGILSEIDNNIRSVLLTKHNRLFYKIYPSRIDLLNILDTRQNPDKNKYKP